MLFLIVAIAAIVPLAVNSIESGSITAECAIYDDVSVKNTLETHDPVVRAFLETFPDATYYAGGIDESDPPKRTIEYKHDSKNTNIKLGMYVREIGPDLSDCFVPLHYVYEHQDGDEYLNIEFYSNQQKQAVQVIGSYSITSPYEQLRQGIGTDDVKCRLGFQKIIKYSGVPACVSSQAEEKLINRGWALGIPSHSYKIIDELKQRPQNVSQEQKEFVKNLVLLDSQVYEFVDRKELSYFCCKYPISVEDNAIKRDDLQITFYNIENKKKLDVIFNLADLKVTKTTVEDFEIIEVAVND